MKNRFLIVALFVASVAGTTVPAGAQVLGYGLAGGGGYTGWFGGGFGHWGLKTARRRLEQPEWELIPGLWYFMDEGGQFPRDPVKHPFFRNSRRYVLGAVLALGTACALMLFHRSTRIAPGYPKQ